MGQNMIVVSLSSSVVPQLSLGGTQLWYSQIANGAPVQLLGQQSGSYLTVQTGANILTSQPGLGPNQWRPLHSKPHHVLSEGKAPQHARNTPTGSDSAALT